MHFPFIQEHTILYDNWWQFKHMKVQPNQTKEHRSYRPMAAQPRQQDTGLIHSLHYWIFEPSSHGYLSHNRIIEMSDWQRSVFTQNPPQHLKKNAKWTTGVGPSKCMRNLKKFCGTLNTSGKCFFGLDTLEQQQLRLPRQYFENFWNWMTRSEVWKFYEKLKGPTKCRLGKLNLCTMGDG